MANKNIGATTDHNGNVFLLQTSHPNFWRIVSAEKIQNNQTTHKIVAVGQERHVRKQWEEFVKREKSLIANNYDALAHFSARQTGSRA